ncbi:MAG: flagellar basal body protein FliL [Alphaproteobacteria bacterium]|nr:flagellar basal body protein FliL [Alphaproteobacteria bacterium]
MADKDEEVENEENAGEETDGEGSEGGQAEGGRSKKKLIIIVAALVLLLGGGGAAAYFMGYLNPLLGVEEEHAEDGEHAEAGDHGDEKSAKKKAKKKEDHGDGHGEEGGGDESAFIAIPTILVNLNTEDGTPRYLRLTVQLELEDPSEKADVEAVIPRVIDQFQTYLRELRVRDLRGSAGIYRLQMELLWRVNRAADPVEIKDVLFQEILIQ